MSDQKLHPQREAPKPPMPCREIERIDTGPGTIIVFESMEDRVFESRNPHREYVKNLPILRVVLQNCGFYVGERKRWTVVIDGLSENGAVFETAELVYVEATRDRHLTGYQFSCGVTSVRVVGWRLEPAEMGCAAPPR
jgi:hypothetical protein